MRLVPLAKRRQEAGGEFRRHAGIVAADAERRVVVMQNGGLAGGLSGAACLALPATRGIHARLKCESAPEASSLAPAQLAPLRALC